MKQGQYLGLGSAAGPLCVARVSVMGDIGEAVFGGSAPGQCRSRRTRSTSWRRARPAGDDRPELVFGFGAACSRESSPNEN